jgi:hypothetical protein
VAAIALVVTAVLAVGGWLVSQAQARRAARRTMRISYLLDTYRRLDRASNRQLNPEYDRELEAAVSDLMLLGSPEQAELAADFARKFATGHFADTHPLLLMLRNSLRRELLLGDLPSTSYVSLRVSSEGDTASATAHVWRETIDSTLQSIKSAEPVLNEHDESYARRRTSPELAANVSPSRAVADSAQNIEDLLRKLLARPGTEDTSRLDMQQLASRALQGGLIGAPLADSINKLGLMHLLATMDQDRLTPERAAEFVSLSAIVAHLIESVGRPLT